MKISLEEIKQAFDCLIKETKSREEVASWAQKLQTAEDNNDLNYHPPSEEDKIWEGIGYLTGVDLLGMHEGYLYSIEDLTNFIKEIGLNDYTEVT